MDFSKYIFQLNLSYLDLIIQTAKVDIKGAMSQFTVSQEFITYLLQADSKKLETLARMQQPLNIPSASDSALIQLLENASRRLYQQNTAELFGTNTTFEE